MVGQLLITVVLDLITDTFNNMSLNIAIDIKNPRNIKLNDITNIPGYYLYIYDKTPKEIFSSNGASNGASNALITDMVSKLNLAKGSLFEIDSNFLTTVINTKNEFIYRFSSFPGPLFDIQDEVFYDALKYFIELLVISSSSSIKITNSNIVGIPIISLENMSFTS